MCINLCNWQVGQEAIEAADKFFRNTWNAQRTQFSFGRMPPDSLAHMTSFMRPLMVPATMQPAALGQPRAGEAQAFINPAFLMPYGAPGPLQTVASIHDSNGGTHLNSIN